MSSFDYQKSTLTKYRNGTIDDPYIDITETKTVINGQILLNEIPLQLNKVVIGDMFEISNTDSDEIKPNEYRVDYSEGIISFHNSAENTQKTYSYKGRGNHYVSATRIWTEEHDGNVVKTLKDAVDASNEAIIKVDNLDKVIAEAEVVKQEMKDATDYTIEKSIEADESAIYAREQGDYALTQGNFAKEQGNYAKDQGNFAKGEAENAVNVTKLGNEKIVEVDESIQRSNNKIDELETERLKAVEATLKTIEQGNKAALEADSAKLQGEYAKQQGDFAKLQGEYAEEQGAYALEQATSTKEFLVEANNKVVELDEALTKANDRIAETEEAITETNASSVYAKEQGDFAKEQGEFSKSVAESLVHKGNYSETVTYDNRNIVYYNGATFMCVASSLGNDPTNSNFWKRITNMAWQGRYITTTTYNFGDVVTDETNQSVYMCIVEGTVGVSPSVETNWDLLMSVKDSVDIVTNLIIEIDEVKQQAITATTDANLAAAQAMEYAEKAEEQGKYAKDQGDYAKQETEIIIQKGTALINKGTYKNDEQYKPLNIVVYENGVYQNIVESIGVLPTEPSNWQLLMKTATSVTWDSIAGRPNVETIDGAQTKADQAEESAKNYTNESLSKIADIIENLQPIIVNETEPVKPERDVVWFDFQKFNRNIGSPDAPIWQEIHLDQGIGDLSHVEGEETVAVGKASHAEGHYTRANVGFDKLTSVAVNVEPYSVAVSNGSRFRVGDTIELIHNGDAVTSKVLGVTDNVVTIDQKPEFIESEVSVPFAEGSDIFNLSWAKNYEAYGHAEGYKTYALGIASHAEGQQAQAIGQGSHAEGFATKSTGYSSHAEGNQSISSGDNSHAEGFATKASGATAHTEGNQTEATAENSHAEGFKSIASGIASHAEGVNSKASGVSSHAEGSDSQATGDFSHAEGERTFAIGKSSHAEGDRTQATGNSSHAEGSFTQATATGAHSEGAGTKATGYVSHAEGLSTTASGHYSHAQGEGTLAFGEHSHAEGIRTIATGEHSHAEGIRTIATGKGSHTEGEITSTAYRLIGMTVLDVENKKLVFSADKDVSLYEVGEEVFFTWKDSLDSPLYVFETTIASVDSATQTVILSNMPDIPSGTPTTVSRNDGGIFKKTNVIDGNNAHAEGLGTSATGNNSHAEGLQTTASGEASHAEGRDTIASGVSSHAEGARGKSTGLGSHAEGVDTIASNSSAHAEGSNTTASGRSSHAEGSFTKAKATSSHAEGNASQATGENAHAEGEQTIASGRASHAEGSSTTAIGEGSHAEGVRTKTSGNGTHAEGTDTVAIGYSSHSEGAKTVASGDSSHAEGYNTLAAAVISHAEGQSNSTGRGAKVAGFDFVNNTILLSSLPTGTIFSTNDEIKLVYEYYNEPYEHETKVVSFTGLSIVVENLNLISSSNTQLLGYVVNLTRSSAYSKNGGAHAEGYMNLASGYKGAHVEGSLNVAIADSAHAEGYGTIASGLASHAEGNETIAAVNYTHAEGHQTVANSTASHVEGISTYAGSATKITSVNTATKAISLENTSHGITVGDTVGCFNGNAGGMIGKANVTGVSSNIITVDSLPTGYGVGQYLLVVVSKGGSSYGAHAEGRQTIAVGKSSHAEGDTTKARGEASHAEGYLSEAYGQYTHVEGRDTKAFGTMSHAEGYNSASGHSMSHVEGWSGATGVYASRIVSLSGAMFTIADSATSLFSVNDKVNVHGILLGPGIPDVTSYTVTSVSSNTVMVSPIPTYQEYAFIFNVTKSESATSSASYASHVQNGLNLARASYSNVEGYFNTDNGFAGASITGRYGDAPAAYSWSMGNGTYWNARGLAIKILSNGAVTSDGAYSSSGADYAEMFEWSDDNRDNEDRVGYFVTLDGNRIRKATSEDEYILGIVSADPSVIGDNQDLHWKGRFLKDEWGRTKYHMVDIPAMFDQVAIGEDESGNTLYDTVEVSPARTERQPMLNPDWDADQYYARRELRPEWSAIGMMGKLLVRDDGTAVVNGLVMPNDNGIATASDNGYRVMKRISKDIIQVLVR